MERTKPGHHQMRRWVCLSSLFSDTLTVLYPGLLGFTRRKAGVAWLRGSINQLINIKGTNFKLERNLEEFIE